MTSHDHYQNYDLREVNPLSRQNTLVAAFLIAILVIVVAGILSSPDIEGRQEAAIPWSPHPPVP